MNCVLSVAQPEIIVPKPHQLKWHEAEMGAVFHYDLPRIRRHPLRTRQ